MIEHGHQHRLVAVSIHPLDDGRVISSRCQGSPSMDPTGGCTLEQQTVLRTDGQVDGVRLRFNGVWFSVLDVLRLADGIGFEECPACHGTELLYDCEVCLGVGVLQEGVPVGPPDLRAR